MLQVQPSPFSFPSLASQDHVTVENATFENAIAHPPRLFVQALQVRINNLLRRGRRGVGKLLILLFGHISHNCGLINTCSCCSRSRRRRRFSIIFAISRGTTGSKARQKVVDVDQLPGDNYPVEKRVPTYPIGLNYTEIKEVHLLEDSTLAYTSLAFCPVLVLALSRLLSNRMIFTDPV